MKFPARPRESYRLCLFKNNSFTDNLTLKMPLDYDPEYNKAIAPIAATAQQRQPATADNLVSGRKTREAAMAALFGRLPEVPTVEQTLYHATAEDGYKVPIIHFRKKAHSKPTGAPALLHIHGGGMTVGNPQLMGRPTARIAEANNIQVFSVDYRLAPEHKQDTLTGDCYAALLWLRENAGQFGIDIARIGVMGQSAGGGLSAGVAILARDKKLSPPLAKQILVYPMLDDRTVVENPAVEPLAFWTTKDNIVGWEAYTGISLEKRTNENIPPHWSPSRLKDFSGLPPTYLDVGTLDIFCSEGLAYASKLIEANVPTEVHVYPGIPHGFELLAPEIEYTKMADRKSVV